jgi:hypothetical protein
LIFRIAKNITFDTDFGLHSYLGRLLSNIDTDHPVFRIAAPEYQDADEDILAERIAERWKAVADLSRQQAITIVKQEFIRLCLEKKRANNAFVDYSASISAVLAYIADSAAPLVELDAVAYCYGLIGRAEESMEEIASRNGCSKQAFSKKIEKILTTFHLKPKNGMRPQKQRKIYKSVHTAKWKDINQDQPRK